MTFILDWLHQAGGEASQEGVILKEREVADANELIGERCSRGVTMGSEKEIAVEHRGDLVIFRVKTDVTRFSKPYFQEAYEQAGSSKKILIVFNEDTYFNSDGLKLLIELLAKANEKGQVLVAVGLSEHFKKIFSMVGLTKFVTIYDSEEDVVEKLGVM